MYTAVRSRINAIKEPPNEKPYSYGLPFITGRIYNIWWGTGIDFTHMAITTAPNFNQTDQGIRFKFNYTANRELFNVGPMRGAPKDLTTLDYIS